MSIIKKPGWLFLISFFWLGSACPLAAQETYRVEHFTTDNGLPSNGIKGLEWDSATGFLWIATEAGVTRYNGAQFLTFSKQNTPELYTERMLFMLKNLGGRIYASDETGNIFFVWQNRVQYLGRIPLDTRPSIIKLIGLGASGQLFRQSASKPPQGSFGFDFFKDQLIPIKDTRVLIYHTDTVERQVAGLYDYHLGDRDPVLLTPLEKDSRIFILDGKLFTFSRQRQFIQLDLETHRQTPISISFPKDEPLPFPKSEKLFWESGMPQPVLIAGSRAWLLHLDRGLLRAHLISEAVPTDMMLSYAQYAASSGTLFLGTNSKGIVLIRRNAVRTIKKNPPNTDETTACYSQLALPNGTVMTNRLGFKAAILGGPAPARSAIPVITPRFDNFLLTTPDSVLWYSNQDSVYRYDYQTRKTTGYDCGKGAITTGFALCSGHLYFANAVGIGVWRSGRLDYLFHYPLSDINSNAPFSMIGIEPDVLAIASCNGLYLFDARTNRLDTLLHLPGICVRALWMYKGYLFIGTYGKGIYIRKNGILRPITLDKNNYLLYAHCFIRDRQGLCWISTNKGLFSTNPDDMIRAYEKQGTEVYYQYVGRNEGMDITELNGGCTPCALALGDSTLSFPSMDGLVWINPYLKDDPMPAGSIYIDDAWGDAGKINLTSLVMPKLAPGTRDLVFHLGFPAWQGLENLYVEYKLEPYQPDWKPLEPQDHADIHFSNLPPGDYRLTIRKLNGYGDGNYSTKEARFRIVPHWYQEGWAWIMGILLLGAMVFGAVVLRTRRYQIRQKKLEAQIAAKTQELQRKNEELEKTDHIKTRLISIISHDLITPLKFLHLSGKSLIEPKSELSEQLREEVVLEIIHTSKELELLSTNILNWIKYRNEERRLVKERFSLFQLTTQLFGLFNSMAKQKQIRLINQVDPDMLVYQLSDPVRVVLYNLILNGINFTHQGYILVSTAPLREGVSLIIADTGVGMTNEQITNIMADHFIISSANVDNRKGNGLGYLIIKDLLKIIRGTLSIQSEKGKGTTVIIRLPG